MCAVGFGRAHRHVRATPMWAVRAQSVRYNMACALLCRAGTCIEVMMPACYIKHGGLCFPGGKPPGGCCSHAGGPVGTTWLLARA